MNLASPLWLLALLALPVLYWLHRRARPQGDRPYVAFFLLPQGEGRSGLGERLRNPWLLLLRLLALGALALAAAGPSWTVGRGTLVLTAGPLPDPADYPAPLTIIRVGTPPTQHEGATLAPVIGELDWGAALLFGRTLAPNAQLVLLPAPPPSGPRITGAGAALDGDQVVVTATAEGTAQVTLQVGERRYPLEPRHGDFALRAPLPAGPAELVVEGGIPWPLCLPDRAPLTVADDGFPPAVESVLKIIPNVERVPAARAQWRAGPPLQARRGLSLLAPAVTHLSFPGDLKDAAEQGPAAASFPGSLPPPGAVIQRFRPITAEATPLLYAGDAPVVGRTTGPEGATLLFGFRPEASDLPETAGWPVLFLDAVERTRALRGRCRTLTATHPASLWTERPVTLTAPDGTTRRFTPQGGLIKLTGLDQQGHFRLSADGVEATLAVVPPKDLATKEAPTGLSAPAPAPAPQRALPVALALVALGLLVLLGRRDWALAAAALLALASLVMPSLGHRAQGPIIVAVDTSSSMPKAALAKALLEVETTLKGEPTLRVEGDGVVRRAGALSGAPSEGDPSAGTRHSPLLAAAELLAPEGGAVILLTDGRAEDGPIPSKLPVFPLLVGAETPDARVVHADAVRLGDQVFARVVVECDRAAKGEVVAGSARLDVTLRANVRQTVQAIVPAKDIGPQGVLEVSVELAEDQTPANDRQRIPIRGERPPFGVAVGEGAAAWLRAGGLVPSELPAAALAEAGARLSNARALVLVDQPAARLAPEIVSRLRRWVETGGVLLLAGRTQAFGLGGFAGTPLDALSPLASDPRPPGAGRAAVALLIDRSGSMAREAGGIGSDGIARVVGSLTSALAPEDLLASVAFGTEAEVQKALTPAHRVATEGLPTPSSIRGGTRAVAALDAAQVLLARAPVEARVALLISDGQFIDSASPQAAAAVSALKDAGITLVAVLVGAEPTLEPVSQWAAQTGGVVFTGSVQELPYLAAVGTLKAATGELLAGPANVVPGEAWPARVGGPPPRLDGWVRTSARDGARILASAEGDPVLAEWSIGQGRVIALATDKLALSSDQWAALLSPASGPRPTLAEIRVRRDRLTWTAQATDPAPAGQVRIEAEDGTVTLEHWRAEGPGRASLPLPKGPPGLLEVTSPSVHGPVTARVFRPLPAEVVATGPLLAQAAVQAELTGGQILASPQALAPVLKARGGVGGFPLAPLLLLTAFLLVLWEAVKWSGVLRP